MVPPVFADEITAVLDGQQRLTALNIGRRGSYAYKLPRRWWNSPDAFPKRHLYLNILSEAEENEDGIQYDFRFLTDADAETGHDETHCWYPVRDILKAEDAVDLNDFLVDRKLANQREPFRVLARLHKVVHTEPVIAYYEEEDQDLDKVLDIFIRTNSGATTLSYSDILMSIATAQWSLDAREAIHGTVDDINRIGDGFGFSQDFLLKAGLMLAGVGSVGFRVTNFNRNNMKLLEDRWDPPITRAVRAAVELVARFGFSQGSLSANNAVLPIAHYLYRRDTPQGFLSRATCRQDRDAIRSWLTRSLLKRGIWGSGLDSLLTALRSVIDTHGGEAFPTSQLEAAMRVRGKSLTFEEEELEHLVESKDRTFTLLTLLLPFVDLQSNKLPFGSLPRCVESSQRLHGRGAKTLEPATHAAVRGHILEATKTLEQAIALHKPQIGDERPAKNPSPHYPCNYRWRSDAPGTRRGPGRRLPRTPRRELCDHRTFYPAGQSGVPFSTLRGREYRRRHSLGDRVRTGEGRS